MLDIILMYTWKLVSIETNAMVFTKTREREITIITTIQQERHNEMKFCLSPTHTRKKCIVLLSIRYDALALLLCVLIVLCKSVVAWFTFVERMVQYRTYILVLSCVEINLVEYSKTKFKIRKWFDRRPFLVKNDQQPQPTTTAFNRSHQQEPRPTHRPGFRTCFFRERLL